MVNESEGKMPISILQDLFNAIDNQTKSNLNPIIEVADILDRSKESIYRRFRGDSAFTLNELWKLNQHYTLPLLFTKSNEHGFQLVMRMRSEHLDFETKFLTNFQKEQEGSTRDSTYLFTNVLPMHYIISQPTLYYVKRLFWNYLFNIKTESTGKQVEHQFNKPQNTHEVWTTSITQNLIQELDFVVACGIQLTPDQLFCWYTELIELLKQIIFNTDVGAPNLYQSEVSFPTTISVPINQEDHIVVAFSDVLTGRSLNPILSIPIQSWARNVLNQCVKISGQSTRLKRLFYRKLLDPIKVSAQQQLSEEKCKKLLGEMH